MEEGVFLWGSCLAFYEMFAGQNLVTQKPTSVVVKMVLYAMICH